MTKRTDPIVNIQLIVTLKHIEPPIWRRIVVPGEITLLQLHNVIQATMGWTNSHLHEFRIGSAKYGTPSDDPWDADPPAESEDETRLNEVLHHKGLTFEYTYDFGDNWEHEIVVEDILPTESDRRGAYCPGGARRCPPEDVGGPFSYQEFLEAIADPGHEEHEHYIEWISEEFDPEAFEPVEINKQLEFMSAYWRSAGGQSRQRH